MEKTTFKLQCNAIEAKDYFWGKGMMAYIYYKSSIQFWIHKYIYSWALDIKALTQL